MGMTAREMQGAGKRALIVDDVLVNRKLAVAFLSRMGWSVADVDGGKTALQWLASNPPVDLVLLDISMPDMDGEDVCRDLRGKPEFADLIIVAYTAHALQHDVERFMSNGFNAVLIKPISLKSMTEIIEKLFRK